MNNGYLNLSDADKNAVTKELKHLIFAARSLLEDINKDQLRPENAGMMVSLLESYQVEAGKLLGYETELAKQKEKRFIEIREKSKRIDELEKMLASNKPIDGLQEQLSLLYDIVDKWWSEEGFYHISDFRYFAQGHIGLKFCFMMSFKYSSKREPENGQMNREEYLEFLKNIGYEAIYSEGNGMYLLDTETNRLLLKNLLVARFPSIRINKYENRNLSRGSEDYFVIFNIDATISNLHDV